MRSLLPLAWLMCVCMLLGPITVFAAEATTQPQNQNRLPQDHDYQRALRAYLASLTEADLAVEIKPFSAPPANTSLDGLCRLWVLSQHVPQFGGIAADPAQFMLSAIESEKSVMRPPADPICLAWLAAWDDAMNPYRGSPAVKRRALAVAIVDMIMTDGLNERSPGKDWVPYGLLTGVREGRASHSDCLGGTLIWIGYTYLKCRDVLPPDARAAFDTGLIKLVRRVNDWGPTALMTDMDMFSGVSLDYSAKAVGSQELSKIAEAYTRNLFTNPRFFSAAGYWVDIQGYDASYNGISFYFSNWSALSTKWDFARAAVEKAYRLKAHMSLPEPDGTLVGPTHFSPRTSNDSAHDQWGYPHRNTAGALITDEAMYLVDVPNDEKLREVPAKLVTSLSEMAASGAKKPATPWSESHWNGAFNYGFEHYPTGFYERRRKLEKERPEMLVPPFARKERFVRDFAGDFVVANFDDFGVIVHTGPVGVAEEDWPTRAKWMPREKPYGFSGGSLSAFWMPKDGAILLGRRGGAQGSTFDKYEEWRLWPFHAVTGQTAAGKVFTSGRILRPALKTELGKDSASIDARGVIPRTYAGQGDALVGDIQYQRRFEVDAKGVRIETRVSADGKDAIAELCETIPVYIAAQPPKEVMGDVVIEFRTGGTAGAWTAGGVEYQEKVDAVKVKRKDGTILITFDTTQRIKLSPKVWSDQYQSRATCRTLLIDLMGGAASGFKEASVKYTITPLPRG